MKSGRAEPTSELLTGIQNDLISADVSFQTWPLKEFSPVTMTARLGGVASRGRRLPPRAALLGGRPPGREYDSTG